MSNNITKIYTQTKYSIIITALLALVSLYFVPFQMVNTKDYPLMNGIQLAQLGFILYLALRLKPYVRKEFTSYFKILIVLFIVALCNTLFSTVRPFQVFGSDIALSETNIIDYLPYSVLNYIEATITLICLLCNLSIRVSKKVVMDIVLIAGTMLLTMFLFTIGSIDLLLEKIYSMNVSFFHVEILFCVLGLTTFLTFLMYAPIYTDRILIKKKTFMLYIVSIFCYVLWGIMVAVNLAIQNFWIPLPLLGFLNVLTFSVIFYTFIKQITSLDEEILYMDEPKSPRYYDAYFAGAMVINIVLLILLKTVSIYFGIVLLAIFPVYWRRIAYIKSIEERLTNELEKKKNSLQVIAHFDQLTELPNRQKLFLDAQKLIDKVTPFSLLLVDIERFRYINSFFTNKIGDVLLIDVSERFSAKINKYPVNIKQVYRLNGDEFAILIGYTNRKEIEGVFEEILSVSEKPFAVNGDSIKIGLRIASSTFPTNAQMIDSLLNSSKLALNKLKKQSIERIAFYSKEMEDSFEEQFILEKDLQVAISKNELELHYQPQYSTAKKLIGFEALVRWNHPVRGRISPINFIPLAEETGLIVPLGEWVLKEACQQLKQWMNMYTIPLQMSVNISVRQLQQADFAERAKKIVEECHVLPELVMLEVTETYPFYTDENIVNLLKKLKEEMKFKIAIDDFGTGFCSLTSLTKVPIDQIKIAREYVNFIGTNHPDEILLKNAIRISKELNFEVIAEGVETENQLNELKVLKCDLIQGYYFSPPVDKWRATELLEKIE